MKAKAMTQAETRLTGLSASAGFASGKIFLAGRSDRGTYTRHKTPDADYAALVLAIDQASEATAEMMARAAGDAADILEFQLAMLGDDTFAEAARALIEAGTAADAAWTEVLDREIESYTESEEEYFRARAADLTDIRDRVLRALRGDGESVIPEGSIYLADDITPSAFLDHDWTGGGISLRQGSTTSHVAMLARQRGVPMVVRLGAAPVEAGAAALLDAASGCLTLSPGAEARSAWDRARVAFAAAADTALRFAPAPGCTADGTAIAVHVNIADPADIGTITIGHVDGVGLMRTEFLYSGGLPDEETQVRAYRTVLEWAGGKPVTIRTADAGGDKPVPGFTLEEANPFLGVRGIRLCLAKPDIFRVQIRALLRSAPYGNLKVMLPMVSVPGEIAQARLLFEEEFARLTASGIPAAMPDLGIMVEVPSVAITPERFGAAAFFSIGSNDLTQYVLAASRDQGALAALARTDDPAVLSLIGQVCRHGQEAGIPVSLCGDAASDPALVPLLLRAGLRSLSVAAARIGAVKAAIAAIDISDGSNLP
jgi:phosphotransferase system enzyme I (PtsI)